MFVWTNTIDLNLNETIHYFVIVYSICSGYAKLTEVFVDTDQQVTLQTGSRGVLPCRVTRQVDSITWSRGPTFVSSQPILAFLFYDGTWEKLGTGYTEGLYDINANFSLIINNVTIEDRGYFFCEMLDRDIGQTFENQTQVAVFGTYALEYQILWTSKSADCIHSQ